MTTEFNQDRNALVRTEQPLRDIKTSGSAEIAGGEYGEIHVSGSARYSGDISCRELHTSGSLKGEGSITVAEDLHVSGSCKCAGNVTASEVHVSGSATVDGAISCAEELHISGAVRCRSIAAKEVKVSGRVETVGDVEGDFVKLSGGGTIGGLLNAENIEIRADNNLVSGTKLFIGSIGGSTIRVLLSGGGFFRRAVGRNHRFAPFLVTESIEGDDLELDTVRTVRVSGRDVVIHSGCEIKTVEYSGTLTVDEGAEVGETVKL
ncbi:MAG: polymer-forming cytoskeletal protein [Lachnospiraceae bacterium]|nr:polymer-forming cytoskeletal protein [Lachnospiraceae bacterium]